MSCATPAGRRQILVADDEPAVLRSIQLLLQRDGHSVAVVGSGEEALAQMENQKFDLIITDYSMTGMRGDQLVARILLLWPAQPVIMASAFVKNDFGPLCHQVRSILEKPFSLDSLRAAVAQAVARSRPGQPPAAGIIRCAEF